MMQVTMHGKPVPLCGKAPQAGMKAPNFHLLDMDMKEKTLDDFAGKRKILNVFQSVDTPMCAKAMRHFNECVSKCPNTVLLCISHDTPFALKRFCESHGCMGCMCLSMMLDCNFCKDYGLMMMDGPMKGMCARAVFVLDENNQIMYHQVVPEVHSEPNYEEACNACMQMRKGM